MAVRLTFLDKFDRQDLFALLEKTEYDSSRLYLLSSGILSDLFQICIADKTDPNNDATVNLPISWLEEATDTYLKEVYQDQYRPGQCLIEWYEDMMNATDRHYVAANVYERFLNEVFDQMGVII